jgi:hypothetical protein
LKQSPVAGVLRSLPDLLSSGPKRIAGLIANLPFPAAPAAVNKDDF